MNEERHQTGSSRILCEQMPHPPAHQEAPASFPFHIYIFIWTWIYSSNIHNFNISKFGWLWSHVMPLIFVYFFHMASEVRSLFRTLMTAQHTVLDFSFFDSRVKWMETMNEWTMKIRDSEEKHSSGEQVMRLALWLLWERESPSDRRKKRKHIPPQNLSKSIRGRLIMAKQNQSHHSRAFTSSEVKWGRSLAAAPPFLMKGCTVSLTQTDREEEKKKKQCWEGEGKYYHFAWPHLSSGGSIFLLALK